MPKVFTHLCKKVNLSLYDDTLTVYTKPFPNEFNDPQIMVLVFSTMLCSNAHIDNFFMTQQNELGVYRFVKHNDSNHHMYHQDNFDRKVKHYHAQFKSSIDTSKLEEILSILEKYSLITSQEHDSFLNAYQEANTLPHDISSMKKDELHILDKIEPTWEKQEKDDQPKLNLDGSNIRFFLSKSQKNTISTLNISEFNFN
ncbi:MAG: hypothetical protein HYX60_08490 [Legionella longbeachae]|nr:hypothetical protein [Legionella longbeachae]